MRLRELRRAKGVTLKEFGNMFGLSESAMSHYETGTRKADYETLLRFSEYFGCTLDYLVGKGDSPTHEQTASERVLSTLPLFDTPVSAGMGTWLSDGHDYEYQEFEDAPPNATFALKVRGDSMTPQYEDNDIVFVRTCVDVESWQVGIFFLNGEGYMKLKQGNRLVSLNKSYEPITIGEYDTFFICGRVLGKA